MINGITSTFNPNADPASGFIMSMQDAGATAAAHNSGTIAKAEISFDNTNDLGL